MPIPTFQQARAAAGDAVLMIVAGEEDTAIRAMLAARYGLPTTSAYVQRSLQRAHDLEVIQLSLSIGVVPDNLFFAYPLPPGDPDQGRANVARIDILVQLEKAGSPTVTRRIGAYGVSGNPFSNWQDDWNFVIDLLMQSDYIVTIIDPALSIV